MTKLTRATTSGPYAGGHVPASVGAATTAPPTSSRCASTALADLTPSPAPQPSTLDPTSSVHHSPGEDHVAAFLKLSAVASPQPSAGAGSGAPRPLVPAAAVDSFIASDAAAERYAYHSWSG